MAIVVVCPGCRKSFQVSDKFGGQTGPCPSCKTLIKIPTKAEEVKIHGEEEFSAERKTPRGTLVLKPIAYKTTQFSPRVAGVVAGSAVAVFVVAYFAGAWISSSLGLQVLALLLVSPPLVLGGYSFLQDDELEPYRGRSLYLRVGIVTFVYVALWFVFGRFIEGKLPAGELWFWLIAVAPLLLVGGIAGFASFDLDFSNGMLLSMFYVLVTLLLARTAGMEWAWFLPSSVS